MSDLNNDGKLDTFEKQQHKIYGGRSFFISLFGIILLFILQYFNKIDNCAYPIGMIIGLFLGRSATEDFSPKHR